MTPLSTRRIRAIVRKELREYRRHGSVVAAGADVRSISETRHSLEDVYLELIDEDRETAP